MLRFLALIWMSLCLTACLSTNHLDQDKGQIGSLSFEQVRFERSAGPQCPDKKDTTAENIRCATVVLTYPHITQAYTPQVAEQLNQFIQAQLLDYADANDKQPASAEELATFFAADYEQNAQAKSLWKLERNLELVYGNEQLLTLVLRETGNTGEPEPFKGQRYLVLDTQTGQQLTLADLLVANFKEKLYALGEVAFRKAQKLAPTANLEMQGFHFENNTFKLNTNFGVVDNGLVFAFNHYELGDASVGASEFLIPYAQLKSLIPATSKLSALAQ